MKPTLLAATLLSTGLAATGARAAASAEATLGNITFDVLDLNAHDGAPAGFSIINGTDSGSGTSISVSVLDTLLGDAESSSFNSRSYLRQHQSSAAASGISATATVDRNSLSSTASAQGYGSAFSSISTYVGMLVLDPFTILTVSADASVFAASGGLGDWDWAENGYASAGLSLSGPDSAGGSGSQYASSTRGLWAQGGETAADSGKLFVSLVNATESFMYGYFSASVSSNAVGVAASPLPVPEPGSYALMMAGLGVLGLIVRRRLSA